MSTYSQFEDAVWNARDKSADDTYRIIWAILAVAYAIMHMSAALYRIAERER